MLTARTVQSSCFEPRFEHEEAITGSSNIIMGSLLPHPQRSLGTPKAENAPRIDINEGMPQQDAAS